MNILIYIGRYSFEWNVESHPSFEIKDYKVQLIFSNLVL